jgi:hypothetical protein
MKTDRVLSAQSAESADQQFGFLKFSDQQERRKK